MVGCYSLIGKIVGCGSTVVGSSPTSNLGFMYIDISTQDYYIHIQNILFLKI